MPRKLLHVFLLVLLAALQAAQGAFSGATLCREESGEVAVEWSEQGRCEGSGLESLACVNPAEPAHCLGCVDVSLPSETSVQSPAYAFVLPPVVVLFHGDDLVQTPARFAAAPSGAPRSLASERLSSVRLLV